MNNRNLTGRVATWLCVALLIVLSLVPGTERPKTGLPGGWEHLIGYAGTATIAMLSYRRAFWTISALSLLSSVLEILQNFVPGRSPAMMDVVFSTAGAALGTLMAALLSFAVSFSPIHKPRSWRHR